MSLGPASLHVFRQSGSRWINVNFEIDARASRGGTPCRLQPTSGPADARRLNAFKVLEALVVITRKSRLILHAHQS